MEAKHRGLWSMMIIAAVITFKESISLNNFPY